MDVINIIEKKISENEEPYYFNLETGEKYGEIVGGFAWPVTTDGFLVIAAVDLLEDAELEDHHIRVLAGANESDINIFLKHALKLQKHFSPFMESIKFYGDTTSLAMMELLDQFNRDRRHRGITPFYLTEAPQLRGPKKHEFYAQLIRKYIQSGREILHFRDTALPGYLMGLLREEITKNILNHPPIAALGYALGVLSTCRPRRRETESKVKYERFLTVNQL